MAEIAAETAEDQAAAPEAEAAAVVDQAVVFKKTNLTFYPKEKPKLFQKQ